MEQGRRAADHNRSNSPNVSNHSVVSVKSTVAVQIAMTLTVGLNLAGLAYTVAKVQDIATTVHEIKADMREHETRIRIAESILYNDSSNNRPSGRQGR